MPHARRCRSTPTDDWQQLLLTHFTEQLTYKLIRPHESRWRIPAPVFARHSELDFARMIT